MSMQRDEERKDEERQEQKRHNMIDEWEKIIQNIKSLRSDLCNERLGDDILQEIRDDINGLVRRKDELAKELGMK